MNSEVNSGLPRRFVHLYQSSPRLAPGWEHDYRRRHSTNTRRTHKKGFSKAACGMLKHFRIFQVQSGEVDSTENRWRQERSVTSIQQRIVSLLPRQPSLVLVEWTYMSNVSRYFHRFLYYYSDNKTLGLSRNLSMRALPHMDLSLRRSPLAKFHLPMDCFHKRSLPFSSSSSVPLLG
jgi:hypothetical protein